MQSNDLIGRIGSGVATLRRDLHAYPELAFNEHRTAEVVAAHLQKLGLEVFRGIARTGVIARLTVGFGKRSIGLRATWMRCRCPNSTPSPTARGMKAACRRRLRRPHRDAPGRRRGAGGNA